MNTQGDKPTDLGFTIRQERLTPLKNAPIWNGCGEPTAIHDCIIIKHRARQAVTAMLTVANQLRLFSWRVNADGAVTCTGTTEGQGQDVTQIDLVHLHKYVSACRTTVGELYLQCWDVSNTGAFYPSGPVICAAEQLEWVQLLALTSERLLTIGLGQDGQWHLATWQIENAGPPQQLYSTAFPAANGALAVALCPTTSGQETPDEVRFVTAMHTAPDQLCWFGWRCLADGQLVLEGQVDRHEPEIIDLALATVDDKVVTLLHHADGRLQLLSQPLFVENDADPIDNVVEQSAIPLATNVCHFATARAEADLIIAYTTNDEQSAMLQLLRWFPTNVPSETPSAATSTTIKIGKLTVGAARHLALCQQSLEGNAPILTAVCTEGGKVHLTTWGTESEAA